MQIDCGTNETNSRQRDAGPGSMPGADVAGESAPLRLPAMHRHLVRVFHGDRSLSARSAGRALSPGARRAIRERLLAGTYSTPAAIDELARRLLASTDL